MGRYLSETIDSVLANLQPGDEYYVIDGGSTDGSIEVIRRYEGRLTGWISEVDKGYAEGLHKGFARASGDYMCWVNSGDLLLAGALDVARAELETDMTDMVFGDDIYIDEKGGVLFRTSARVRSLRSMMLFGGWTPLQDACFWRRSLYHKVGGINPDLRFAADFDLFLRFALHGCCRYVPAVFSAFRRHQGQKSIAQAAAYRLEREHCRARALEQYGPPRWTKCSEAYYAIAVRLRARLFDPLCRWLAPAVGTHVRDLRCTVRPYSGA